MIPKTCRWLLLSSLLMLPLALRAHHSPAMFDFSKQLTLTGTVRAFQWTNPHSYIQLVVEPSDGTGTKQEWSLEMGANVYLYERGWRPSTVKAGDTLTWRDLKIEIMDMDGVRIDKILLRKQTVT